MASVTDTQARAAALRLREHLDDAEKGGYRKHAWYAYMAGWDVEALVAFVEQRTGGYITLMPE